MKSQKILTVFTALIFIAINVSAQTGGNYIVKQSVIASGGQNATGGTFSLDGTIGQAVAGDVLTGSPFAITSGFWNYTPSTSAALGVEADVTPRSTSDGVVDATDVQQIERFSIGFDKPYLSNEGQRADCAPRATFGDGQVDATDVQQAERYSIGFDPKTPANGPSTVNAPEMGRVTKTNLKTVSKEIPTAPRTLSIQNASGYQGQDVVVNILDDAAGDETGYTFSIGYDSAKLTNPQIASGGIAGETILSNATTPGQIGLSVRRGGSNFPVGNAQVLIKVTFTIAANAAGGATPITFGSTPAAERTTDVNAQPLITSYVNGKVTINSPTAAAVSVSGRVLTESGRGIRNVVITMSDGRGTTRIASTTNFGYYKFNDVAVGETYVFTARGKRFTFSQNTQVRVITEETNDINFVSNEESVLPAN